MHPEYPSASLKLNGLLSEQYSKGRFLPALISSLISEEALTNLR